MDLSKLTLHDTASNLADHFLVCMVDQIQSKKLKEHIQSDIGNIARELRFLDYEQQVIKPLILSWLLKQLDVVFETVDHLLGGSTLAEVVVQGFKFKDQGILEQITQLH